MPIGVVVIETHGTRHWKGESSEAMSNGRRSLVTAGGPSDIGFPASASRRRCRHGATEAARRWKNGGRVMKARPHQARMELDRCWPVIAALSGLWRVSGAVEYASDYNRLLGSRAAWRWWQAQMQAVTSRVCRFPEWRRRRGWCRRCTGHLAVSPGAGPASFVVPEYRWTN